MVFTRKLSALVAFGAFATTLAAATLGPGPHYATDAYPGFDSEENILATPKKEPGFFSWWSGPKKDTPAGQLAWARACEAEGSLGAARKAYDALVAEWPSSAEAPVAQKALADLEFEKAQDAIQAFAEYKYLLDFYSTQCDYDATVRRLYDVAKRMREDGKRIMFFRFANTTDVRRAFEAVVRRAPGAPYAPEVLLTVAELREEEGYDENAVEVYETLRNIHPKTPEAKVALEREANARMRMLRAHAYNKARCQDTIDFLKMALATHPSDEQERQFKAQLAEAEVQIEAEAFASARFYDSKTRTTRSAINAYERFLREYPNSVHGEAARARIRELQETARGVKTEGK